MNAPWLDLERLIAESPIKGAFLSPMIAHASPLFRFALWRQWDSKLPLLSIVMLNPSTGDARVDDHTVGRLIYFAKKHGYGGFIIVNLFAWRATDSHELLMRGFRSCLGPNNDEWIKAVCAGRDVLVAWGVGTYGGRVDEVLAIVQPIAVRLFSLGVNRDGSPPHPARLGNEVKMEPWKPVQQSIGE